MKAKRFPVPLDDATRRRIKELALSKSRTSMTDIILEAIEKFVLKNKPRTTATNSHQQPPTATNSHQQPPTATNSHQQPPTTNPNS